ncbi:hypothetical protein AAVH_28038, partial [Aphelenchoides avenae]
PPQPCGENEEWGKPDKPEGNCENPHPLGGPPGQAGCYCKPDCVRDGPGQGRPCIPRDRCPTTAAPSSSSAAPSSSSSRPLVSVCAKIIRGICHDGSSWELVQCQQACIDAGLHVGVCASLPSPFNLGALVCICIS